MIPFDDEEEGIAIANDTEFGLYDYVFSKDGAVRCAWPSACSRARRRHTAQAKPRRTLRRVQMSGVGRDGGDYGLLAYTEPRPSSGAHRRSGEASAHRLGAVDRLPDDVGVAGVLGGLGDDVQQNPPCGPRSLLEHGASAADS